MAELTIALAEEIGNTRLFTGRRRELEFYTGWAEESKDLLSKSQAILSRRKKGKTALVQRLFNILYSNNDPSIIPFFYRVLERPISTAGFGLEFYRAFLSQLLGFRLRDPKLINSPLGLDQLEALVKDDDLLRDDINLMKSFLASAPESVWVHAQSAPHRLATSLDIRIIQIIDEFQYMNRFVYHDSALTKQVDLCHSYMGLAESKYAPMLITGSYIGWLTTILNHMTARFEDVELDFLNDEEALETAYNYAAIFDKPVTEETAAYIAEVAYNDPFYISQIVRTKKPNLDLTTKEGVREALQYETTFGKGFVAKVWMEYVAEGLARVNDLNGKKIVLYLAKHGNKEITRNQIKTDLNLDLTDAQLADRLYKLKQADLIAEGSSDFRFKGLGDPIFAAIFRKRYAEEIENMPPQEIAREFDKEMSTAKRQAAWYKGLAGEYKVICFLMMAVNRGAAPEDILFNPTPGFTLNGFQGMKKNTFHKDQHNADQIDIHALAKNPSDMDLIAEVKTWDRPVSKETITNFIDLKSRLSKEVTRPTAFLFYSEFGFTHDAETLMDENAVMYTTRKKLIGSV